jgi:hypothetical protein
VSQEREKLFHRGDGGVSVNVIWRKNMKRGREKRGRCERKRKKRTEKMKI